MIDLVFPSNNEKEFIDMAEHLSYSALCFVYDEPKAINEFQKITKIKLFSGLLVKPNQIQSSKNKANLILAKSSDKNRFVLEKAKPDILFGLENHNQKDYIHHRASGLNQVLCKIAAQNNVIIAFSLNTLLNSDSKNKSIILGRIMQNIRLCRKYKVRIAIASFAKNPFQMRAPNDLKSLALILNADTKQAKEALNTAFRAIEAK